MALPFSFPLTPGTVITAAMFNGLIAAIQDGSIFTSTSFVEDLVTTLDSRVATLEHEVAALQLGHAYVFSRDQFNLSAGQDTVNIGHVPKLDSEQVFLNGLGLAKNDIPVGEVADYYITGSIITLNPVLALQIQAGDRLIVTYAYEV